MTLVSNLFLTSLYFGVIGIFASTSAIGVHHIFLLIASLIYIFQNRHKKIGSQIFGFSKSSVSLWVFIISIILSVILNMEDIERPFKWMLKFKYFLIPLLSIPLTRNLKLSESKWKYFIYFSFIIVMIANVSGFWGYQFGHNFLKPTGSITPDRLSGLNGMVLTYAHNLSFLSILLVGYLIFFKDLSKKILLHRGVLWVVLITNVICLYLSSTRGAWLSFVFSIPFLFLFKVNLKKWVLLCFSVGLLFVVGLKVSSLDKEFVGEKRAHSNTQRVAFFKAAYLSFIEKPVFGLGYKQFEFNVLDIKKRHNIDWSDKAGHAHNNFLEHLASLGILGAISFILFSLYWFIEVTKINAAQRYLLQGFCAAVGISGLTQYTFGDGENTVFIMLMWLFTIREFVKSGGTSWIRTFRLR